MSEKQTSLFSRSPTSRKSLGVTTGSAPVIKRKRAHSIAPVENVKLQLSKRSSLGSSLVNRPTKGILKPFNPRASTDPFQDGTQDFGQGYHTMPLHRNSNNDASDTTILEEFRTDVQVNPPRKSLGGRRVSFAAQAHVRVFESAEQNTNSTDSPSSSPVSSPNPPVAPAARPFSTGSTAVESDTSTPHLGHRRRSSIRSAGEVDSNGEASMELSDDLPANDPQSFEPQQDSDELEDMDMDDDGDMSMTTDFGPGIISRKQSLAVNGRRRSRMRSSIIPPSDGGVESTNFTVSVDRPPPPESDVFKALKALANGNRPDEDTAIETDGEVDMDVTTAVSRLMAIRNSLAGGDLPINHTDDSFTSTEESFDEMDPGDRTMNMTSIMSSFRMSDQALSADDTTMNVASVAGGSHTVVTSTPKQSGASSITVPVFTKSTPSVVQPSAPKSPSKRPLQPPNSPKKQPSGKTFTAAFAPPFQPSKRPLSVSNDLDSPAKKRAIATLDVSNKERPKPFPVGSPTKQVTSPQKEIKGRRPSGYYRKSLGANMPSTTANSISIAQDKPAVASIVLPDQTLPAKPSLLDPQTTSQDRLLDISQSSEREASISLPIPREATPPSPITDVPSVGGATASAVDPSQWAEVLEAHSDDMEPISVEQFFIMTGVRFMDDMACPRRSLHPSQLPRRESQDGEEPYSLSAYAVAMAVDVAQLETMIWIANDIRSAIDKYKAQYRQTEEDAAKDMPSLFREFVSASEEDRAQILYVLKILKAHTVALARASWYDWKRGWIQGLQANAERTLENLNTDEQQLLDITERAGEALPSLRQEYEDIMRELQEERAAVAEIESCNQDYLAQLKDEIGIQRQELDVMKNSLGDAEDKVARLEETLGDLKEQTMVAHKAISAAQRQMELQKASARAEVFRLRDELRSLQDMHLWRPTQISNDLVEFIYDSRYRVIIPCHRFSPITDRLDIVPLIDDSTRADEFPVLTEFMYTLARRHTLQTDEKITLRVVLQRLADFWSSYTQLRWQLKFILVKYPLTYKLLPEGTSINDVETFEVTATLLLQKKTAKVSISFLFNAGMFSSWPRSIERLTYDAKVNYGAVDAKAVKEAIRDRLEQASPEENHACLMDACMEVASRYS